MKRFFPILIALLLLASCGTPEPSPEGEPSPSDPDWPLLPKANITLTVWESETAVAFIEQAAAAFQKVYDRPNISIRCEAVEPSDAAKRAGVGDAPDLFAVPHTDIRALAEGLDALPARNQDKVKNTALASCVRAATVDGIIYGYPVTASTLALFYNRAYVAAPPETWDEVAEFVKSFNDEGRYGFVLPAGTAYYTIPFTTMGRNRPFGPTGDNPYYAWLDSPPSVSGMEVFQRLRAGLDLPAETLTAAYTVQAFASGRAALCLAGPWDVARFAGANINFGVAPLPAFDGDSQPTATMADVRVLLVSAWSAHSDAASAFADFLLTEDMQRLRLELTGETPSVELTVRNPAYAAGFIEQLKAAFPTPSIAEMDRLWGAFSAASAGIWDGAGVKDELTACYTAIARPAGPEEPDGPEEGPGE